MTGPGPASPRPQPLGPHEFARLMDRAAPFEPEPRIAAGVSGGSDSMALVLLADAWARARGGAVVALTVDHGLRPESGAEARRVGGWLGGRGIAHHVLPWRAGKPASGIQAAARAARHRLLGAWCREHGLLHLLLAHHMEDQAETVLLRLAAGSGADGLAGMAPVAETEWGRLLRPLLGVTRARLTDFLVERGQAWIDDPSNRDPAFTRTRVRGALAAMSEAGLDAARLAQSSRRLGSLRAMLDGETAALLAGCAAVYPAGYCVFDAARLAAAAPEIGVRALARIVMCVGGRPYPPRGARLDRLYRAIADTGLARPRTLGGCVFSPHRDGVVVARETTAAPAPVDPVCAAGTRWDRRFRVAVAAPEAAAAVGPGALTIAPLGAAGWRAVTELAPAARRAKLPAPARAALPAVRQCGRIVAVPHLGGLFAAPGTPQFGHFRVQFSPAHPLAGAPFSVV